MYFCIMSNWEKQQDIKKEVLERDKSRRENLGKFFYDLAKVAFAGLVVGGVAPLYANMDNSDNWYVVFAGTVFTIIFAWIGNKILK